MKKTLIFALLFITVIAPIIVSQPTMAATCSGVETSIIECDGGGDAGIWHILVLVVEIMSIGIGITALIGILIFGIQYLTAGGDVAKTTKAKRRMLEIVIGLVGWVVIFSFSEWLLPGGKFNFTSNITEISLSLNQSSIEVGKTAQTTVEFTPSDTEDKTYSLSTNDADTVSVIGNSVKCRKEGTATITATSVNGKISTTEITCTKPTEPANNNSNGSVTVHDNSLSESEVNNYFSNHSDPTYDDITKLAKEHDIDTNSDDFKAILAWVEGEGQSDPNIAIRPNSYLAYLCSNVIINNVKDNLYGNQNILDVMQGWGPYYSYSNLMARAESAKSNPYTLRSLYLAFSYPYPGIHYCYGDGGNPSAPAGTIYTWTDNAGNSVFVH